MDLTFLNEFYVPAVMAACLSAGYCLKRFCPLPNGLIPALMAVLGMILAVVYTASSGGALRFETFVAGAVTGLASTGMHQAFTRALGLLEPSEDDEAEE